jgi:hypothetical protein
MRALKCAYGLGVEREGTELQLVAGGQQAGGQPIAN